jgi:hypothetical protein
MRCACVPGTSLAPPTLHLRPCPPHPPQIATEAAIQEMVLPGMLAVFVPVGTGFLLGPKGLGGLLAGSLGTCFMLALTMANAGGERTGRGGMEGGGRGGLSQSPFHLAACRVAAGAWDNAKKWCEKCASEGEIRDGALTYTFFGVKSESVFNAATKNGTDFTKVLRVGQAAPTTPEEVAALRDSLLQLYHDRHAGAVIGDTVGDPFKDTSGPALNGERGWVLGEGGAEQPPSRAAGVRARGLLSTHHPARLACIHAAH